MANAWEKKLRKGSRVQSVLFDKAHFTLNSARKWLKDNQFKDLKVDETNNYYRFRQQHPDNFIDSSFRTKTITSGIKLIVGIPMKKNRRKDDFIQSAFKEIDEHGTEGSFTRYVAQNFKGKNDPDKRRRVAKEIKRSYEQWIRSGKQGHAPYSLTTYRRAVFYLNIQKKRNPSMPYWAKTIVNQMGGFRRLSMMLGVKQVFYDSDNKTVQFRFPNKKTSKPNVVSVMYVPDTDLYQMDFYRVGKKKGIPFKKVLKTYEDVYNDMLIPLFEQETGLYLRFNNNPKSLKKLDSIGMIFDEETGIFYPMFGDESPDLDNGIHITDSELDLGEIIDYLTPQEIKILKDYGIPAQLFPTDFQIQVLFDNEFQTTLGEIIKDNMDEGVEPVTHEDAEKVRNLRKGQSTFVGMIEITRL